MLKNVQPWCNETMVIQCGPTKCMPPVPVDLIGVCVFQNKPDLLCPLGSLLQC